MGKFVGRCVLLPLVAFIAWVHPFPQLWAQEPVKDEIQTFLRRGVEKGLNLSNQEAVAELTKALELDRKSPVAYAYLAMAYLFSYETGLDEKEKKKSETSLLRAVEDTQTLAEKRLEENPRNADACFSMAIARMVKNRWEILHRNYFRAFREAQAVWDLLEKTRELDPRNFDVYYPMGVLHYHLAQLGGVTRWITSLFITSGDRERGLREFETAYEKGRLMRDLAASSLVSAYSGYEKQPARALPLAKKLKEKYPDNYNFSFALVNIYSDLGRYEEAMAVAGEIGNEIKAGKPPYRRELWPRYHQSLGKISLDRGEYEKAAEYFKQTLKDTAPYNNRVRAWALVRMGMIHDARKERKQAEEYYRKALDLEGAEGMAQRAAREYLETPYSPPTRN
ncbi:MAG: tetratricopeptide repeat protein [Deltaproteobacteria bacterium]|nr:tetratricopeptide repeat protein [Deltaproteobacteria bacterium]